MLPPAGLLVIKRSFQVHVSDAVGTGSRKNALFLLVPGQGSLGRRDPSLHPWRRGVARMKMRRPLKSEATATARADDLAGSLVLPQRFAARLLGLASGLALAVRPAGSAEAPRARAGSRRCFLRSGFCGAVRKELRVPLRVEGPTRTMRGVPARCLQHSPGDRRTWREGDGLVLLLGGRGTGGDTAGTARGRSPGEPSAAAAAPVGLPPGRARAKLPPATARPPG